MKTDLLKDIRTVRDRIGAECGYDLRRLGALVRREEGVASKRLVRAAKSSPRRTKQSAAAAGS